MTQETIIRLPKMHQTQAEANDNARRFNMFCCGRRWGKDILQMRRIALRTQHKYPQAWFAPTYRMMAENYKMLSNQLAPIVTRSSASEHTIEIAGGAVIDFWSLDNFDAARGRKYGWVTVNEAAFAPNLLEAWNYVIRPTLADMAGGADFGFTPKGMNGAYSLWAQAGDNPDWFRAHYTTRDNPYIPPSEIDAMVEALPERTVRQEILAEFIEDGAFFQGVDKCCTIEAPDTPANHSNHRFVAGLDWALSEDFTRLLIVCVTCGQAVDWWGGNRMDFTMQRRFIVDKLSKWHNVIALPERNSIGVPNIEMLMQDGVKIGKGVDEAMGFNTTSSTKAELIHRLATAIEKQAVKLPKEYADELRAYEVETTTVTPKFSAPQGLHDDRVIAAALAVWQMGKYVEMPDKQPVQTSKWTAGEDNAGWSKRY